MTWTNIFTEKKPTSVYHSVEWFKKFMDDRNVGEGTKRVYEGYRSRFVDWLEEHDIDVPTQEDCEKYLVEKKIATSRKQAQQRYGMFRDYIAFLCKEGVMSDNFWEKMDLYKLGVKIDPSMRNKTVKKKAEKKIVKERREVFTLSDVAELLLAIEDEDDEAIVKVLSRVEKK